MPNDKFVTDSVENITESASVSPVSHAAVEPLDFDIALDAKGLTCPEPVMLLHGSVRDAQSGQVIRVEATDPSTQRDIAKFCTFLNHELVSDHQEGDCYVYFIRKG